VLGDRHKRLPRREWNVQIEADGIVDAAPPQFGGERDEMVVVHPYHVVGAQQRAQQRGHPPIDVEVVLKEAGFELRQIEPIVKHRPQHRIGIAEIVPLVLALGQRHGRHALAAHRRGIDLFRGLDLAAPAEPERMVCTPDAGERHGNTPCLRRMCQIGNPIRDQDDSVHGFLGVV